LRLVGLPVGAVCGVIRIAYSKQMLRQARAIEWE
jgi:hypothetical protein